MRKLLDRIPPEYRKFVIVAVVFHLLLILALAITFSISPKMFQVSANTPVKIIQASVVSQAAYEKQQAEKRAAAQRVRRQAEKRRAKRLAEIKRKKAIEQAKLRKEKARKLARKKKAEKLAKIKKEKLAKAKKAQLAKRKKAQKIARERAKALKAFKAQAKAAEVAAAKAAAQRALTIKQKYIGLIQGVIRANWINQFNPLNPLQVTLKIYLDKKGDVQSVSVAQSSGNSAFDRQAMVAVEKSSPLPIPTEASIAKDFRVITLPFTNQQVTG